MYRVLSTIWILSAQIAFAEARIYSEEKPFEVLEELGIQGVLKTVPYVPMASERYGSFKMELDQALVGLHQRGVAAILEIAPGAAPQPLGRMRPYLDGKRVMEGGEGDRTWLPELDDDFTAFVVAILHEHGWPRGAVTGVALGDLRADPTRVAALDQCLAAAVAAADMEVSVRRVERRWVEAAQGVAAQVAMDRMIDSGGVELVRVYRGEDGAAIDRALGALGRFVGQRSFRSLLFEGGLPWVFDFAGLAGEEDGTLVVVGDLGVGAPVRSSVHGVVGVNAQMRIATGPYVLHDAFGDPISAVGGEIVVPLDGRTFFLRGDGEQGSFAALVTAVRDARVEGIEPIEVLARDMTGPVGQWSVLRLELGNLLNRELEGALSVELAGLEVEAPAQLHFEPQQQQIVDVRIVGGRPAADNLYLLRCEFDAGADGKVLHQETMRVNWIERREIAIDGESGDWAGVLPQPIGVGVVGRLAYGADHFYFAAQIEDDTEHPGTLRFAERDDESFFYPALSYEIDLSRSLFKVDRFRGLSDDPVHLWRPDGQGRVDGRWENQAQTRAFAFDLTIPDSKPRQVALYIPPGDFDPAGMDLELYDRRRKTALDRRRLETLDQGVYAIYHLAGKMRITLRVHGWHYRARLGGIFFDPVDNASGFIGFDRETSGEWFDHYGSEGFYVVGAERVDPQDVSLRMPKVVKKFKHKWPEGVRRFSYRQEPVLPSGNAPGFDNVQIAFNAIPADRNLVGLGEYVCTDYEYALNKVASQYGGGTEVWRLLVPGMRRQAFYPGTKAGPRVGPVVEAELAISHKDNIRFAEVAIPWGEIPEVQALMEKGELLKFSFRINHDQGQSRELAQGRSASQINGPAFQSPGQEHWANEIEFGWERE